MDAAAAGAGAGARDRAVTPPPRVRATSRPPPAPRKGETAATHLRQYEEHVVFMVMLRLSNRGYPTNALEIIHGFLGGNSEQKRALQHACKNLHFA